jgi:hypothetical protein
VDRSSTRRIAVLFAAVSVMVGVLLHIGAVLGTDLSNDPWSYGGPRWQQPYIRWDAEWYLSIAIDGYYLDADLPSSAAFFPGYPVPMRWLGLLVGDTVLAGIALSLAAGFCALVAVNGWVRALGRAELAWPSTLVVALSPFSMYLYGPLYADGLLVAATAMAFWALERDRTVPMLAAGAIAAVARVVGAVVPVLLVVRLIERRRRGDRAAPNPALPVLCYATVAAHLVYLHTRLGDAFAFRTAAGAHGWDEGLTLESITKREFVDILTGAQPADVVHQLTQVLGFALTLGVLALLPRTWRMISPAYAVAAGVLIGVPLLSNNDFLGFGRYVLAAFPVAPALASLLREHPQRQRLVGVTSAGLLAGLTLLLGMDYLIA